MELGNNIKERYKRYKNGADLISQSIERQSAVKEKNGERSRVWRRIVAEKKSGTLWRMNVRRFNRWEQTSTSDAGL